LSIFSFRKSWISVSYLVPPVACGLKPPRGQLDIAGNPVCSLASWIAGAQQGLLKFSAFHPVFPSHGSFGLSDGCLKRRRWSGSTLAHKNPAPHSCVNFDRWSSSCSSLHAPSCGHSWGFGLLCIACSLVLLGTTGEECHGLFSRINASDTSNSMCMCDVCTRFCASNILDIWIWYVHALQLIFASFWTSMYDFFGGLACVMNFMLLERLQPDLTCSKMSEWKNMWVRVCLFARSSVCMRVCLLCLCVCTLKRTWFSDIVPPSN
jgi:hypothetical protein